LRRYETIFIADPDLPEEQFAGLVEGLTAAINGQQGELIKAEDWGRKKLAYMVRKHQEGHYMRLEYEAGDGALSHDLERRLRMSEPVLKFMTVRMDNDKKRLVWEAKQAVKEQERAARRAAEEAASAAAEAARIAAGGEPKEEPAAAATSPEPAAPAAEKPASPPAADKEA